MSSHASHMIAWHWWDHLWSYTFCLTNRLCHHWQKTQCWIQAEHKQNLHICSGLNWRVVMVNLLTSMAVAAILTFLKTAGCCATSVSSFVLLNILVPDSEGKGYQRAYMQVAQRILWSAPAFSDCTTNLVVKYSRNCTTVCCQSMHESVDGCLCN